MSTLKQNPTLFNPHGEGLKLDYASAFHDEFSMHVKKHFNKLESEHPTLHIMNWNIRATLETHHSTWPSFVHLFGTPILKSWLLTGHVLSYGEALTWTF